MLGVNSFPWHWLTRTLLSETQVKNLGFCHSIFSPVSAFYPLGLSMSSRWLNKNFLVRPSVSPPLQSEGKGLNSFHQVLFLVLQHGFLNKPQLPCLLLETPKLCLQPFWLYCIKYVTEWMSLAQKGKLEVSTFFSPFSFNTRSLMIHCWYVRANGFNKPS